MCTILIKRVTSYYLNILTYNKFMWLIEYGLSVKTDRNAASLIRTEFIVVFANKLSYSIYSFGACNIWNTFLISVY